MSAKRTTLPVRVHQIWDCIQHGPGGSNLDLEKMISIAHSLHTIPKDELVQDLESAVKDGLVKLETVKTKGVEAQVYALPDPELSSKGDHDWYCFKCHIGGPVVSCEDCPRVFHLECLEEERKPHQDLFVCPPCHITSTKPSAEKINIKQKQLNTLISYCVQRVLDWGVAWLDKADGKTWALAAGRPEKEAWRMNYFVHTPIDLDRIEQKATGGKYTSIEEFQVDCESLVHAGGCFFGTDIVKHSSMGGHFFRDIMHDISEIKLCHDCFRRSNEKDHPWWFCLPCQTPHEVVWAKQSGYPFWPAKVMKKEGNKYDVRYFGGSYDRGIVDVKSIQPIETPLATLKVRKSAAWNDAYEELQKFLDIAKNPELIESLPPRGNAAKGKGALGRTSKSDEPSPSPKRRKLSETATASTPKVTPEVKKRGRTPQKPKIASPQIKVTPRASLGNAQTNGMSTLKKNVATPKAAASNATGDQSSSSGNSKTETTVQMLNLFDEFVEKLEENHQADESTRKSKTLEETPGKSFQDPAVSSSCNESHTKPIEFGENVKGALQQYRALFTDRWLADISSVKRKQWCFNCEREAIYHCCWNTAYCSTTCQQLHWTKEHKRLCRRIKRDRNGNPIASQPLRHDDF